MPASKPKPTSGDEQSTDDIEQYWDKVVSHLKNRGVPVDYVEDFAQQTFVNAYVHLLKERQLRKPLSFLYTIANNVVKKNFLDQKLATVTDSVADFEGLNSGPRVRSAECMAVSELEFEATVHAIGRLPKKCRMVFISVKIYGESYEEVAKNLGISKNTVRLHMIKGLSLVHGYCKDRVNLLKVLD